MHSLLGMSNVPHKHASAWDLRTAIKEEYELPRHLGKSLDMESSLIGKELDDFRLHQSDSLESQPLVRRKSGSADSIPSLVQNSELVVDFSTTIAFNRSTSSIDKANRRAVRARHQIKKNDVPLRHYHEHRVSKDWKKQPKLQNFRNYELSHLKEKWKYQKVPRDHKLSDHIIAELVPSIAKMTCRDTQEKTITPGHF